VTFSASKLVVISGRRLDLLDALGCKSMDDNDNERCADEKGDEEGVRADKTASVGDEGRRQDDEFESVARTVVPLKTGEERHADDDIC